MLHKHGSKSHGAVYKGRGAFLKSVSYQNHVCTYFVFSLFDIFSKSYQKRKLSDYDECFFTISSYLICSNFVLLSYQTSLSTAADAVYDPITTSHRRVTIRYKRAKETPCDIIVLKRRTMS